METFEVVLNGTMSPNDDRAIVAQRLADLFKITPERAAETLAGRYVIKRGVDQATAHRYRAALIRIGVRCDIQSNAKAADGHGSVEQPPPPIVTTGSDGSTNTAKLGESKEAILGGLMVIYLIGVVIATYYNLHHGPDQFRGFFYNLGLSFAWPFTLTYFLFRFVVQLIFGVLTLAVVFLFCMQGSRSRND